MWYTLCKWAAWIIAAAAVGGAIGWLLRAALHRGASAAGVAGGTADVDRLKARLVELEVAVADRDRLHQELDECRAAALAAPAAAPLVAGIPIADHAAVVADRDRLASAVADHLDTIGDLRARLWNSDARLIELQALVDTHHTAPPPDPDVSTAAAVLGEKIALNDLTVVEGIGPKIAELCRGKGIATWWQLANTDPGVLRAMLEEAGPRFQIHDPGTWPQQARLLAGGAWGDFKTLTDELRGGKTTG